MRGASVKQLTGLGRSSSVNFSIVTQLSTARKHLNPGQGTGWAGTLPDAASLQPACSFREQGLRPSHLCYLRPGPLCLPCSFSLHSVLVSSPWAFKQLVFRLRLQDVALFPEGKSTQAEGAFPGSRPLGKAANEGKSHQYRGWGPTYRVLKANHLAFGIPGSSVFL